MGNKSVAIELKNMIETANILRIKYINVIKKSLNRITEQKNTAPNTKLYQQIITIIRYFVIKLLKTNFLSMIFPAKPMPFPIVNAARIVPIPSPLI